MKIMFLAGSYWPAQDGVAHVTEYLAEGLTQKHDVFVMAPLRNTYAEAEEYRRVRIERIHAKRVCSCDVVGDKRKVFKRIKQYGPDVLIVVGIQNWGFDWTKRQLNNLPGKKILMTHGCSCLGEYDIWNEIKKIKFHRQIVADILNVYITGYWKKYKKTFPKYIKKFDLATYLFEKEPLYAYMVEQGATNGKVLENATEDIFFERNAYIIDSKKPICFINVSNYEERKNQKLLLNAFYEADIPESDFVLIGSKKNDYYEELVECNDRLAAQLHKCHKASIYVGISRSKVLNLYKNADVYLSASRWEAMSISICEAAAAGLTIISTPAGHVEDIPGVWLFTGKERLVEIMRKISKYSTIREESGKKAYEYARINYKIQSKINQLEDMISKLFTQNERCA